MLHWMPVVSERQRPATLVFEAEALRVWRARVADEEAVAEVSGSTGRGVPRQGFPPVRVQDDEEIFTSLGNGHFFQACPVPCPDLWAVVSCVRRP